MTTKQLIEKYEASIETATEILRDLEKDGTDVEQHKRVSIKRSCYNTFLAELNQLKEVVDNTSY